eukprot:12121236-Alexandrium_andersonii.AAC.1
MYVAIEEGRMRWPSVLLVSRAVMLPKTDKLSTDCMDYRLLSICSVVYRRWAALRLRDLKSWTDK